MKIAPAPSAAPISTRRNHIIGTLGRIQRYSTPMPTTVLRPTRRRSARFWALFFVIIPALIISWPLHQRHAARRDLNAHVAALRARGEPVTFADLAPPPIPDDQNAAFHLKRAAAALRYTPDEERAVDTLFDFLNSPT